MVIHYQKVKKIARSVILALENSSKVHCKKSKDGKILAIKVLETPKNQQTTAKEHTPPKEATENPDIRQKINLSPENAKAILKKQRFLGIMGGRLTKEGLIKRGERHENWLHTSLLYLINVLVSKFLKL